MNIRPGIPTPAPCPQNAPLDCPARGETVSGVIFDIDHFSTHDGPGIRAVVYFKGCPLRCTWCHSPESQSFTPEFLRIAERCRHCNPCAGDACPHGARVLCGREIGISALMDELLPDRVFFESSGGGVTLSGGEALAQPGFACAVLSALRREDIHTVLETSGMGRWEDLAAMSPDVDLFYYDVKFVDTERHRRFTGAGNEIILDHLERLVRLRDGRGITLRAPLIPGYNDGDGDILALYALAQRLGLTAVHLLPYNPSAGAKYEWLGRPYAPGRLERQSAGRLEALRALAPSPLTAMIR